MNTVFPGKGYRVQGLTSVPLAHTAGPFATPAVSARLATACCRYVELATDVYACGAGADASG